MKRVLDALRGGKPKSHREIVKVQGFLATRLTTRFSPAGREDFYSVPRTSL